MVKTVILTGAEVCVSELGGQNTVVKNLGEKPIFVAATAGITESADGVSEIPAGGGEVVFDTHGTVYLVGTGKAQVTGTNYACTNFKQPSSNARDRQAAAEEIPAIEMSFGEMAIADIAENVTNTLTETTTETTEEAT